MPVSRYVTLKPVEHNQTLFAVGTPMALSDEYAAPLLAAGAIQTQAGALPAMPAVPGPVVQESIDSGSGQKRRVAVMAESSAAGVASTIVVVTAAQYAEIAVKDPATLYLVV